MAEAASKGGKKGRKIGREAHHPSHVTYTKGNVCAKNKAKRVLRSNGLAALREFCDKNSLAIVSMTKSGKHHVTLVLKNIVKVGA